jgi:hypothetical protein
MKKKLIHIAVVAAMHGIGSGSGDVWPDGSGNQEGWEGF